MSVLVDYASSDDEEEEASQEQQCVVCPEPSASSASTTSQLQQPCSTSSSQPPRSSDQPSQDVPPLLPPPFQKLPDASLLLSSPNFSQSVGTDHSSRVAAAMADNASRKREADGSSSSSLRAKLSRGNIPHSKIIPDTSSGLLTPPQLRGRSNVVTEDISKLFVKRNPKEKS